MSRFSSVVWHIYISLWETLQLYTRSVCTGRRDGNVTLTHGVNGPSCSLRLMLTAHSLVCVSLQR